MDTTTGPGIQGVPGSSEAPGDAIRYSFGCEYGPNGIHGAHRLAVDAATGAAVVERCRLGKKEGWQVQVSPEWLHRVTAAADQMPAPSSEPLLLHPDQHPVSVQVGGRAWTMPSHDGPPEWERLVGLLDAPLWLVCPEYMGFQQPAGMDPDWVHPAPDRKKRSGRRLRAPGWLRRRTPPAR